MINFISLLFLLSNIFGDSNQNDRSHFPSHWWKEVPKTELKSWEISPSEAKAGEVILSKRNELGILSNFSKAPFRFHGKKYNSIEGFWQMMFFPENEKDERAVKAKNLGLNWKYTRSEVSQMIAFEAKTAGDNGFEMMNKLGIDYVMFEGRKIKYWDHFKGEHYKIIKAAMNKKLNQNEEVKKVLLSTKNLKLKPDHHQPADVPPSWKYYEIWMELREELIKI